MDEFERLFAEEMAVDEPAEEDLDEKTPEHLIREGHARFRMMASLLLVQFHTQYGEPMTELFQRQGEIPDSQVQFHLTNKSKK